MPLPARRTNRAGRIEDITDNAEHGLVEALAHQRLGEVNAIEERLEHLRGRRDETKHNDSARAPPRCQPAS